MRCSIHGIYHKGECPDDLIHTDENGKPLEITPPLDTKFGNFVSPDPIKHETLPKKPIKNVKPSKKKSKLKK